jgi:hypothetical protein
LGWLPTRISIAKDGQAHDWYIIAINQTCMVLEHSSCKCYIPLRLHLHANQYPRTLAITLLHLHQFINPFLPCAILWCNLLQLSIAEHMVYLPINYCIGFRKEVFDKRRKILKKPASIESSLAKSLSTPQPSAVVL